MQLPATRRTGEGKQKLHELTVAREEKNAGNKWVHNSIFRKRIMENGWRWTLFSFAIFICELANSMFCQTKNAKPLELLL